MRLQRLRAQVRKLLTGHRKLKTEMVGLCDRALMKTYAGKKDVDALRSLRNTDLQDVQWRDVFLKYVVNIVFLDK